MEIIENISGCKNLVLQLILLIIYVSYILFSSINFDNIPIQRFKKERNFKIICCIALILCTYKVCGFNLIF